MSRRDRSQQPFSLFAFQDIITSVTGIIVMITLILTLELLQREPNTPAAQTTRLVEQLRPALAAAEKEVAALQSQLAGGQSELAEAASLSPSGLEKEHYETAQAVERLKRETAALESQAERLDRQHEKQANEWDARAGDRAALEQLQAELAELKEEREQLERQNRVVYNPAAGGQTAWLVEVAGDRLTAARAGVGAPPLAFDATISLLRQRAFFNWAEQRVAEGGYFVLLVRPQGIDAFDALREGLRDRGLDFGFDLIGRDATVIDPVKGAGY
jgi:hypothetical protein